MSNLNKTVDIHKLYNAVCTAPVYQATVYILALQHALSQTSYIPTFHGGGQHHLPQGRQNYSPKKSLLEAVYLVTQTLLYFSYPHQHTCHKQQHFPTVSTYLIYRFSSSFGLYEGWNFNSGNYLFTTDTK